ncbi:GrpB family protein [Rhizobium lusitanum]|uniref:GrpB family protein n=1 Tax=Rhizobium lusitanum TaxID=293958 RepID=A0A6L9U6Q4_9HYPH|nr:GrpB family protein [Rhizobium lusitanum]
MASQHEQSFGLGVGNKSVRLAEPNQSWHEAYLLEEAAIRGALGDLAVDVQHFGSTSIPEIKAKPIIDIAVGVRRFEDGIACIEPMASIGYVYAGSNIVPNDHIFGHDIEGDTRTHLVHVVEYGGVNWCQFILFRDRMRKRPDLAHAYEALKVELAAKYANDRASYTAAKKDFIQKILAESD